MKYGIAIFPSKSIQDEVNSYRKRYDPHYALVPPHITLKEAFDSDDNQIKELTIKLREIAAKTKPFPLNINKISTFSPVTNTIFLKVDPVPDLVNLFKDMQTGIFQANQTYPFVPHITIAQKLSHGEYSDIYGSLRMKDIQIEDQIDRFQLLYQLENGSWTVYESFVFGDENNEN